MTTERSRRMKVLLVADVDRVGWLGDVVEVKTGYARNYLLPVGLAVPATEANLRSVAEEAARRAEQRQLGTERLKAAAAAVEAAEAVVAARANEAGLLFGSVTARHIAANLRQQGFEVADDVVQLAENIKEVGTYSVSLKFAEARPSEGLDEDLTATVSVVVVAKTGEENGPADKDREG